MPSDLSLSPFAAPISQEIWDMKYRLKKIDGTPIDQTVQDTWSRIATALAAPEKDPEFWSPIFYRALEDFKFLPAGRIIAGAGSNRNVTLFNCYVMGTIPDSMDGIFDMLKEAALTMQQGGGIGYDFTPIRPKGAPVKGVAADASGPLTFMDCWDAMCRTVMSAGSRRGAMMATMRCDHPDILDFVKAKHESTRLRMFNMSVLITDKFMDAVRTDDSWDLIHKVEPMQIGVSERSNKSGQVSDGRYVYTTMKARELWDKIMQSTYDYAEPGVIFIDKVNRDNNLNYIETITATNPCGEQPLPPYGACLLGSINMAKLVQNPFGPNPGVDRQELEELVKVAVRMMDNVNDISNFPLEEQRNEAQLKRRIGLGMTGLADALAMCGLTYGTQEAAHRAGTWAQRIAVAAYKASVELAKTKGAFPSFEADGYLSEGTFASRLPEGLKADIRKHGIRNSHLTSIAPTGTISLYAGNVSSGVEPIFANSYTRKVLQPDGSKTEQLVEDYAVSAYRALWENGRLQEQEGFPPAHLDWDPSEDLPDYFVSAQTLNPSEHVRMQAAVQKWVDTAISKTINVPEDADFREFKEVYDLAFESGCKGCTTYRPNDVTGSVLSVEPEKKEEPTLEEIMTTHPEWEDPEGVGWTEEPKKRPAALPGVTYKVKFGSDPHALYITMTDIEENGQRRPFEVFINSKNMEHYAWTVGLTRMISAVFRRPHDSRFVVEELKAVFDPKGGAWVEGQYVPSVLAAIGRVIKEHMVSIGYWDGEPGGDPKPAPVPMDNEQTQVSAPAACPQCGGFRTKKESGCETCTDCGYSKCG